MKKKTKVIICVCVLCLLAGIFIGYTAYNTVRYGQIKPKTPVSITTSNVKDTSDICMIGHRGFSAIAPENTLAAFEEACKAGFYGCEFDIHLTSDGHWVVMHDSDIKLMTGVRGEIEEMTLAELEKIPFTNGANIDKFEGTYIPTLEQTLELLSKYDIAPIIEIKTDTTEKLDEMLALIEKYALSEKTWIISFEKAPLLKTRELDTEIKMSFLTHEVTQEAVDFCIENNMNGLDFSKKKAGENEVKMITDAGLVPQVWTVDAIEDFERFYSYGVRYFTGNCLTY